MISTHICTIDLQPVCFPCNKDILILYCLDVQFLATYMYCLNICYYSHTCSFTGHVQSITRAVLFHTRVAYVHHVTLLCHVISHRKWSHTMEEELSRDNLSEILFCFGRYRLFLVIPQTLLSSKKYMLEERLALRASRRRLVVSISSAPGRCSR